jgi:hypothetical protein
MIDMNTAALPMSFAFFDNSCESEEILSIVLSMQEFKDSVISIKTYAKTMYNFIDKFITTYKTATYALY